MKQVVLQRAWSDNRATLGMLSILGVAHDPIFTLENPLRVTDHDSRIPSGEYVCEPYSGTKFIDVYMVKDVPGRTSILIHPGNKEQDTEGCILLGLMAGIVDGNPMISQSRSALNLFKELIGQNEFWLILKERSDA